MPAPTPSLERLNQHRYADEDSEEDDPDQRRRHKHRGPQGMVHHGKPSEDAEEARSQPTPVALSRKMPTMERCRRSTSTIRNWMMNTVEPSGTAD